MLRILAWLMAAGAILVAFFWMSLRRASDEPRHAQTPLAGPEVKANTGASEASLELASDGIPIMKANARAALPAGPVHPHPITPEHERVFEENRTLGVLNGAMDVGDVAALRQALARYTEQYPEDSQDVQAGYAVVADCLEFPGQASRSAAERWSAEHHGSTVRRFVMRHCLEK